MRHAAKLEIDTRGDVLVVTLVAKKVLDPDGIVELGQRLLGLVDVGHRKIVLNLQNVEYMASTVLRKFFDLRNKLLPLEKSGLVLCDLHPAIAEVFTIAQLGDDLPFQMTEVQAVERLQAI